MFQFSCRFAVLSTVRHSNCTPKNNASFDAVSSKRANFDEVLFFKIPVKHTPKLIIFGTHDTLISELLLMQFYLFNICPKLHRRK